MKQYLSCLLVVACITSQLSFAQGIAFKTDQNWLALKERAAKERKYIFMDVGATWCIPCHMMEKNVFSNDSVGQFYNQNFINVQLQADSTSKDNQQVKSWYADSRQIIKDYGVHAFPTYLFFSPQGELVYQGAGVVSSVDFIRFGRNALDPQQNITHRKGLFNSRQMELAEEGTFAIQLRNQGDQMATTVAGDYKSRYLDKAGPRELMLPDNLKFIVAFQSMIRPGDQYFDLLYKRGPEIDSLLDDKGRSASIITRMITLNEVIKPIYDLNTGKIKNIQPDWNKISNTISSKYSAAVATEIVLAEKYNFYTRTKNWSQAGKSGIDWVEGLHLEKTQLANQVAYNTLFKHDNDQRHLAIAIKWLRAYLSDAPNAYDVMDTYSGLLYKMGKKKEAIEMEQRAILLLTTTVNNDKDAYLPIFTDNIKKMKAGQATW